MPALLHRAVLRPLLRACLCLALCLSLALTACSSAGGLTGSYVDDTVHVAQTLLTTIAIPQDDPGHQAALARVSHVVERRHFVDPLAQAIDLGRQRLEHAFVAEHRQ